jgi:transcriptional regulator with XRE-family HTH domain
VNFLDSIHERLKAVRQHYKLSQEEFGNNIGIKSRAHISALESGARNVTDRIIKDVCEKYQVNERWLRDGNDSMLVEQPSDLLEKLRQEYNLNELEFRFMFEFISLSPNDRDIIFSFLARIFNRDAVTLVKKNDDVGSAKNDHHSYELDSVGQADLEFKKKLDGCLHELEDEKRE